jgi:hypothetical protein
MIAKLTPTSKRGYRDFGRAFMPQPSELIALL